ncbi:MBOAT family O-acyltransferase [Solwaraspora sp. WMMB335]|uniref:MBOAT family O-acyltransferase n=1 Tax=Solwaraspora sp. WMMB335 TaxID=3404118 RepID=UPI003B94F603
MVFSSPTFLFLFLPLTLLGYLATPARLRNGWLLLASVLFYFWGAGGEIGILLYVGLISFFGALIGWRAGRRAQDARETGAPPAVPRAAIVALIALLLVPIFLFKYLPPLTDLADSIGWNDRFGIGPVTWALPLGISFFTFHAISYVVDTARGSVPAERSLRDYLLYLFLFPHQIAGPIVRYAEIVGELKSRRDVRMEMAAYGVTRFAWGLAKKACIADSAGLVADAAFGAAGSDMSAPTAWLAALAYTVQIYFDFSGYSDMAIGLAMLFGFRFPENFKAPYAALGPADFWRRWHITLSRWFRDYVYIPLGGSRHGIRREYAALLVTFGLTSLWHGATWPFLVWGGLHSLGLLVERLTGVRDSDRLTWLRRAVTAVFIVAVWVPFRAETLTQAGHIWRAMVTGGFATPPPSVLLTLTPLTLAALLLGLAAFLAPRTSTGFQLVHGRFQGFRLRVAVVSAPALLGMAVVGILWLDFSPFLYFQF